MWKGTIVGDVDRRAIFLIRHHGAITTHPLECRRAERRLGIRGKSNPVERNIIFWCSDDRSAWRWSSVGRNPWNPLIRWPSWPYYFWQHTLPPRSNSISSIWYHVGIGLCTYPNYNPWELLFATRRIIYIYHFLRGFGWLHLDRCMLIEMLMHDVVVIYAFVWLVLPSL